MSNLVMDDDIRALMNDLKRDEGVSLRAYTDTVGKITIGIGRNLTDVGITQEEAETLFLNDIDKVYHDLDTNVHWWRKAPNSVKRGLSNMCFNLGWPRLRLFTNMLQALYDRDYDKAADEALDSDWATQVGERAQRIADLFRSAVNDGC